MHKADTIAAAEIWSIVSQMAVPSEGEWGNKFWTESIGIEEAAALHRGTPVHSCHRIAGHQPQKASSLARLWTLHAVRSVLQETPSAANWNSAVPQDKSLRQYIYSVMS